MRKLGWIALSIVLVFGFVGTLVSGIITHELTHRYDLKEKVTEVETCGFIIPQNWSSLFKGRGGYFSYDTGGETEEEIKEMRNQLESRANFIQTLTFAVFFACGTILIIERFGNAT